MSRTGIVIVTHNSAAHIGRCLDAALKQGAEIVVIDNASEDATRDKVARHGVRLIANRANLGFAAAVNQGARAMPTEFLLLLNPDARILTGIEPLETACGQPGVAAAAGKLIEETGRAQAGFNVRRLPAPLALAFEALGINRVWPRNPVNRHYRCHDFNPDLPGPVEQPAGALLLLRRSVWEELDGFDEDFFPLWFEDVDFCQRALDRGYRIWYEPRTLAEHSGGHSLQSVSLENRQFYWYRSFLRYAFKHFRPVPARALCLAVGIGSWLRLILEICSRRSLKPVKVYGPVVRLAAQSFVFGWRLPVKVLPVPGIGCQRT